MMSSSLSALKSSQNGFFIDGKTLTYEFRVENLKKLGACIREYEPQIIGALKADLGKSELEAYVGEIGSLLEEIRFAVRHLKKWMKPERVATPMIQWPAKSRLYSEPLGVVLIIAPWNYPVQLALSPLIGAIAAGNCAVIKPSEVSNHTSRVIEEMISKTFPENYIAVVTGGVEVSQSLLSEPWDHIFFTGGTEIGRKVMMEASKTLTPVTLELGGKSPCLIDSDVDWEVTAKRIVWGKFFNAGQTCVAPDYLLLPKGSALNFISTLEKTIRDFYSDNPQLSSDYGRIINVSHYERLKKYLSQGKVVIGGKFNDDEKYISPTVMMNVSWDSEVMIQEIFGPILPIMEYETFDQAIGWVQSRPKPLALYFFSRDKSKRQQVLRRLSFGGGCINDILVHLANPKLPFGGVGPSGMGRYHGKFSFDTFSHKKSIVERPFWLDLALRYPPYEGKLKYLKKIFK